ncbi:cell division protein ZapC [Vibrio sp. S4M6]|uniref:cell division protein ZapC n=1 Tax=Vibrio sinus TaxID=2946865 RepID=UPI00202A7664|nr:cell division protein ZapC [Vibrio sinus]MCL9783111.1 cell division protein ZapC [Vibrio sinus]
MLKPSDKWAWYYDEREGYLMLDLGDDIVFKTNLPKKLLVDCAFGINEFSVDDASAFQTFREQIATLDIDEPRQAELTLYCVAAKRFHKTVQPRSWFFDRASHSSDAPEEGDIIYLENQHNRGHFIVLDVGDSASLCSFIDLEDYILAPGKELEFGQAIKVMHDRFTVIDKVHTRQPVFMAG